MSSTIVSGLRLTTEPLQPAIFIYLFGWRMKFEFVCFYGHAIQFMSNLARGECLNIMHNIAI